MKLVVGLGNPGWRYRRTRHNVGFEVINGLAKLYNIRLRQKKHQALLGEGIVASHPTILAKPTTFVNNSGSAVKELVREHDISLADLLLVCDDMNLPLGKLRIRRQGSSGGHKGLTSVSRALGSQEFPRLRIGIGPPYPPYGGVDYVLSRFKRAERKIINEAETTARQAVEAWLAKGIEFAMANFN